MGNTKLRIDDLVGRAKTGPEATRLMNVKVPTPLLARISALAEKLRVKKTDVVVAILNEGLATAESELKGWKAPPKPMVPKERRCSVSACDREKTARGLCATHYQAQRRAKG